ncbi:MAG: DUF58 domain-containing protein [Thermodesulfobacteriota bacterium]
MNDQAADISPSLGRLRALPCFLSGRFFFVFVVASLAMVPWYFGPGGGIWVPLLLDAALILAAAVDYFLAPSPEKIALHRPVNYPLPADKFSPITIEISNRAGMPVSLLIHDDFPEQCETKKLPMRTVAFPGSQTTVSYRLKPLARGDGPFGDLHFWCLGPLGLVWRKGRSPGELTAKFYPGLALIEERRMRVWRPAAQEAIRLTWRRGAGTEFDNLRDYVSGDDSRLIHWSTSARRGKPVIRQNRVERSQTVFIVLDAGRMMTARVLGKTKLDHGLDAAVLLAYAALALGDKVGVMVVGQEVACFLPPANAPAQLGRILDATYRLQPKMQEPRFYLGLSMVAQKLKRRALVLVFTDLIDERASQGLLRYSLGLLPRHLPLVVAMSDTDLVDLADSVPKETSDLYRQGVAAGMLARREQLLAKLSSAGVMIVDARPEQISAAVLDRYLEIKHRGLL